MHFVKYIISRVESSTVFSIYRLCIVITDGASRYPDATIAEADALRDQGVRVIAVGIKVIINLFQHFFIYESVHSFPKETQHF